MQAVPFLCQGAQQLDQAMNGILGRKEFSYDADSDPAYQAYKKAYTNAAQQSMLNADGSVNTDSYLSSPVSKPRRNSTGNPGTPDDETEEDGEQQPLGDGLMTLMLCACAYLIVRATRKEEKIG